MLIDAGCVSHVSESIDEMARPQGGKGMGRVGIGWNKDPAQKLKCCKVHGHDVGWLHPFSRWRDGGGSQTGIVNGLQRVPCNHFAFNWALLLVAVRIYVRTCIVAIPPIAGQDAETEMNQEVGEARMQIVYYSTLCLVM